MKSIHQIVLPFITMDLFEIPNPLSSLDDLPDFELTVQARREAVMRVLSTSERTPIWQLPAPVTIGLKFSNIGEKNTDSKITSPGGKTISPVSKSIFGELSDTEKNLMAQSLKYFLTQNRPFMLGDNYYVVAETYELSSAAIERIAACIRDSIHLTVSTPSLSFHTQDNGSVFTKLTLPLGRGVVFRTKSKVTEEPGGNDAFKGNLQFLGERYGFSIIRPSNRYCFKRHVTAELLQDAFSKAMKVFEKIPQIEFEKPRELHFVTPAVVCA